MGLKNSKNKVKSASHTVSQSPESPESAEEVHSSNTLLDDMVLFHKVDSRTNTQNRSFIDSTTSEENVQTDTTPTPAATKPASILVHSNENNSNISKNPNASFVKFKSRSEISTRHVIFASSPMSDYTSNEEILKREKTKFNVRFAEKVLVMNSSDLDRLYNETLNQETHAERIQELQKYFVSLNDQKLEPAIARPKKKAKGRENRKIIDINKNYTREFESLRSWNIVKENTFYEEDRKSATT